MNARDTRRDGKVQCPNPMDHVNRAEILFGSWEQNLYGDTHNAQQNKKIGPVNVHKCRLIFGKLGFVRARTGTDINTQRHALTTC